MELQDKLGFLFVVSGPSGAGKGTICREIVDRHKDTALTVSATTRKPRDGEEHGVHYYFLERAEFLRRLENQEFLEYNEYCGNLYGTLYSEIQRIIKNGQDCILEIDVHGALNVKKAFPNAILVFVLPPSVEVLKHRLIKRGTETEDVISHRLAEVENEISVAPQYDYLLINDVLEDAISDFESMRKSVHMAVANSQDFIKSFKF